MKDLKDSMYIFPAIEYPYGILSWRFKDKYIYYYDVNKNKLLPYYEDSNIYHGDDIQYLGYFLEKVKDIEITSKNWKKIKYEDLYTGAKIKLINDNTEYIFLWNIPLPKKNTKILDESTDFDLYTIITILNNQIDKEKEKKYEKYKINTDRNIETFLTYLVPSELIDQDYKINTNITLESFSLTSSVILILLETLWEKYNDKYEYTINVIENLDNSIDYILNISNWKKINITKEFVEFVLLDLKKDFNFIW